MTSWSCTRGSLATLVNEAALHAARGNRTAVRMIDFEFAKDKVLMGTERRSMILSDAEKRITATHEAGHALLTVLLPHADPIHKVKIIPRGMAAGPTLPVKRIQEDTERDYIMTAEEGKAYGVIDEVIRKRA